MLAYMAPRPQRRRKEAGSVQSLYQSTVHQDRVLPCDSQPAVRNVHYYLRTERNDQGSELSEDLLRLQAELRECQNIRQNLLVAFL